MHEWTVIRVMALSLSVVAPAAAQSTRGTTVLVAGIADAKSGLPLQGAELLLPDLRRLGRADALGEIRLSGIPRGKHRVRVRHVGYAPSDIDLAFEGDTVGPVFMLERTLTALDTVRVVAEHVPERLRDFEARRKMGIGRFLDETVLAKEGTRDFTTVMVSHVPGVRMMPNADGRYQLASTRGNCGNADRQAMPSAGGGVASSAGRGRGAAGGGSTMTGSCTSSRPCILQLYLDGIFLADENIDLVRTWDLAGVEYYTGNSVPAQYRVSGAACGVLLLWSR